jgi:para-nitrobenzyl esterase
MRFATLLLLVASSLADESIVNTPLGAVQGVLTPLAREFHGLPYASPPVGALRWAAPTPPAPWAPSLRPATADGPGCMQECLEPSAACPLSVGEDCLYLNVYTPRARAIPPAGLPVLVWIHGGNFRDGFGGGPLYNGSVLAQQGMIVVTINYRLGVFGWLLTNATSDGGGITGNFGFQDQRAALAFVRDNIAPFGGDPSRVTLMGQSAGAMSTASHLVSPASRGLFHGAVLLSEPFALPFRTVATALDMGAVVLGHANCSAASGMQGFGSPAACMRAQPAAALLAAQLKSYPDPNADWAELLQIFMPMCPTVGTADVPNWPLDSFQGRAGAAPVLDVPIMMGTTSQEGVLFIYSGFGKNVSVLEFELLIEVMLGDAAAKGVAKQYPIPTPQPMDTRPIASVVTTASIFKCANRNVSRVLAASAGRTAPIFACA